jgi:hypothetical protein
MKKKRILLLLSSVGVVVIGYFLLADFLSPNSQVGDLAKNSSVNSVTTPKKRKTQQFRNGFNGCFYENSDMNRLSQILRMLINNQ